ncbi:MAG: peptidoglycan recognition family protein [Bacteroidota bacterium]
MKKKFSLIVLLFVFTISCSSVEVKKGDVQIYIYPNELDVETRQEWGWKEIEKEYSEHEISKITIHHGGVEFKEDKDPVQYLKNLQSWSRVEKNWVDIPYHYMIDLNGKIYEARPLKIPGDTNTEYNPAGHALICVMGDYEIQKISNAQLNSVVNLAAYLANAFDIPPDSIKGHKDYAETLCPGTDLYSYLLSGEIVSRVKTNLSEKVRK